MTRLATRPPGYRSVAPVSCATCAYCQYDRGLDLHECTFNEVYFYTGILNICDKYEVSRG